MIRAPGVDTDGCLATCQMTVASTFRPLQTQVIDVEASEGGSKAPVVAHGSDLVTQVHTGPQAFERDAVVILKTRVSTSAATPAIDHQVARAADLGRQRRERAVTAAEIAVVLGGSRRLGGWRRCPVQYSQGIALPLAPSLRCTPTLPRQVGTDASVMVACVQDHEGYVVEIRRKWPALGSGVGAGGDLLLLARGAETGLPGSDKNDAEEQAPRTPAPRWLAEGSLVRGEMTAASTFRPSYAKARRSA